MPMNTELGAISQSRGLFQGLNSRAEDLNNCKLAIAVIAVG